MLNLIESIIPFLLLFLVPLIIDGFHFLSFYYTSLPTLKKEWIILAKRFELITAIKPNGFFLGWALGTNLSAWGSTQNYLINFNWKKTRKSEFGELLCKVEIKNPHKIAFFLKKGTLLIGKKRLAFETPYFKENFSISTNNIEEISQIFNEEIQHKVRRIFAIELDANLTIERTKNKTNSKDILDERDSYSLVYYNPNYQINNKRQNVFMQETLLSILNIAKRIDASN